MAQKTIYKAYIAGNRHTKAFDFAHGKTIEAAIAAVKRKNSPDWRDCCIWAVPIIDGIEIY